MKYEQSRTLLHLATWLLIIGIACVAFRSCNVKAANNPCGPNAAWINLSIRMDSHKNWTIAEGAASQGTITGCVQLP